MAKKFHNHPDEEEPARATDQTGPFASEGIARYTLGRSCQSVGAHQRLFSPGDGAYAGRPCRTALAVAARLFASKQTREEARPSYSSDGPFHIGGRRPPPCRTSIHRDGPEPTRRLT